MNTKYEYKIIVMGNDIDNSIRYRYRGKLSTSILFYIV